MAKKKFGEKVKEDLNVNSIFIDMSEMSKDNTHEKDVILDDNKEHNNNECNKEVKNIHINNAHKKDTLSKPESSMSTTIHTTIEPKIKRKNERFNLVIQEELVNDFNVLCEHLGVKRTYVINKFIASFINANKKTLKELKIKDGEDQGTEK